MKKFIFGLLVALFAITATLSEVSAQSGRKVIVYDTFALAPIANSTVNVDYLVPAQIGSFTKITLDVQFTNCGTDANNTTVNVYGANTQNGLSAGNITDIDPDSVYSNATHGANGLYSFTISNVVPRWHKVDLVSPSGVDSGYVEISLVLHD